LRPEHQAIPARGAGFTLAEMAIVLVIVGLLLTSVISTVSTQVDARNVAETQSRLNQIKDALIGFAQANGRLPCPADPTIASGCTNAGVERSSCTTTATQVGVVPWATLGVSETDVWGRRFTYKVVSTFSDAISANTTNTTGQSPDCSAPVPTPTQSSFALCSLGNLSVNTRTASNKGGSSGTILADKLPLVIISHGKNGYGAWNSGGPASCTSATQLTVPSTAGPDETANATSTSTIFYSREQSPQTSSCSDTTANTPFCEFDDLVAYIPANVLVTKMVSAGKLP
jgi:prepilin-type N-terminal cleavage/methylation domain-containing protein